MSDDMRSGFDGWSDEEIADYWQQIHEHREMMADLNRRIEQAENQTPPEQRDRFGTLPAGWTGQPTPPDRNLGNRCSYT